MRLNCYIDILKLKIYNATMYSKALKLLIEEYKKNKKRDRFRPSARQMMKLVDEIMEEIEEEEK